MRLAIGRWLVEHDPDVTRRCYARLPVGTGCSCRGCRNFDALEDQAFTTEFVSLAGTLGIDPRKPVEVLSSFCDRASIGLWLISGWFHFIGTKLAGEDALQWSGNVGQMNFDESIPGVKVGVNSRAGLVADVFKELPVLQLDFETRVPWVLDEPAPTLV